MDNCHICGTELPVSLRPGVTGFCSITCRDQHFSQQLYIQSLDHGSLIRTETPSFLGNFTPAEAVAHA